MRAVVRGRISAGGRRVVTSIAQVALQVLLDHHTTHHTVCSVLSGVCAVDLFWLGSG